MAEQAQTIGTDETATLIPGVQETAAEHLGAEGTGEHREGVVDQGAVGQAAAGQGTQDGATEPTEAEQKEAARVAAVLQAQRVHMDAAANGLAQVLTAVAEISATLTWDPACRDVAAAGVSKAAQGLSEFKAHFVAAGSLGAEPLLRSPTGDLPKRHKIAVASMREFRRRIDAQISLMEKDVANVPALVAMERAVAEQLVLASVNNRGLARALGIDGHAR